MYRIGQLRPYRHNLFEKGVDLGQRIGDWAVHTFREHHKEVDLWAGFGVLHGKE